MLAIKLMLHAFDRSSDHVLIRTVLRCFRNALTFCVFDLTLLGRALVDKLTNVVRVSPNKTEGCHSSGVC